MVCFLCGNGKQWNLWYVWASFLSWPRFTWNSKYTWCCALWQANGCLKVWMIPLHRLQIKDPSLQRSETLRQSITFILLITIRTDASVWHLSVGLKDYQLCYWQISPTDPMSRALGNNHTCVISLAFFLDSGAFKLAQTNTSDHPLILASKKELSCHWCATASRWGNTWCNSVQFSIIIMRTCSSRQRCPLSTTEAIHASPRASEAEASFNFTPGFIFRTEHVTVVTCCHSLSTDVINVMFAEHYTFFFYS